MPDLKATPENVIERLERRHEQLREALGREALEISAELRELAEALPAIPERAADLMERAALAASATFELPAPYPPPGDVAKVREVALNLDTHDRGGYRLTMLESKAGVPLPAGRYRALLFVLPVAP